MKNTFTLRSLAVFSFVIFFLPFMRTCSDDSLEYSLERQEVNHSGEPVGKIITKKENKLAIAEKAKEYTFDFYTLSIISLDDFKLNNFSDKTFWAFLGFTIILIFSILILSFSFKNKIKTVHWLSITNLIILLISTLILCFTEVIEKINQIKIGYYLFVINSILIAYLSKKLIHYKL